jgi:hypothetical protein
MKILNRCKTGTHAMKNVKAGSILCLALVAACIVIEAQATLGGDAASVDADRLRMSAKHAATQTPTATGAYTMHQTTLATGTIVRQYVSAAGVVFAVSWSGPFKPDLRQLLGPHFDTMNARQQGQVHAGRPFINQQNADLVIESGGHPRSFAGRAYLPAALPQGVAAGEFQ